MSINIAAAAATTQTTASISSSFSSSPTTCLQQQQAFEQQINQTLPPPIPHPSEQLCYVHCTICDTVLAVSVPSASLFKTVTVRCGHCSNLLPVNMRALALIHPPPPLPSHDPHQQHQQQLHFPSNLSVPAAISTNAVTNTVAINNVASGPPSHSSFLDEIQSAGASNYPTSQQMNGHNFVVTSTNNCTNIAHNQLDHQHQLLIPRQVAAPPVVNRPPEKRQRVPSAYNRFIKDEIQRIKAGNPDITHRQAFSAAAKNWAHFPHIHFGMAPAHHHAITRKTNIYPQEGEEMLHMKDGFLASANVSVYPY